MPVRTEGFAELTDIVTDLHTVLPPEDGPWLVCDLLEIELLRREGGIQLRLSTYAQGSLKASHTIEGLLVNPGDTIHAPLRTVQRVEVVPP